MLKNLVVNKIKDVTVDAIREVKRKDRTKHI